MIENVTGYICIYHYRVYRGEYNMIVCLCPVLQSSGECAAISGLKVTPLAISGFAMLCKGLAHLAVLQHALHLEALEDV